MDTLVWLLFESPPALGAVLALALFVLLAYWRRTLRPRPFLIGLAAAALLLVVQALVVTRREHADRIMDAIERDVVGSRPDRLGAFLSGRFYIEETGWDKSRFLERVRDYMAHAAVRTLARRKLEVEQSGPDRFQIYISYLADISTREFDSPVLSRWRIGFVREAGGWRIATIIPISIDQRPTGGWKGVPRPWSAPRP